MHSSTQWLQSLHLASATASQGLFFLGAGKEGWKLITLLRLSPIIPWNVLNYALSVTGGSVAVDHSILQLAFRKAGSLRHIEHPWSQLSGSCKSICYEEAYKAKLDADLHMWPILLQV